MYNTTSAPKGDPVSGPGGRRDSPGLPRLGDFPLVSFATPREKSSDSRGTVVDVFIKLYEKLFQLLRKIFDQTGASIIYF